MIRVKIKNTTLYKVPLYDKNTFVCFRKSINKESYEEIIKNHQNKRIIFLG